MALDTEEKRKAVPGVGRPFLRAKLPVAAKDEAWRLASGNAYGGNALTPIVGFVSGSVRTNIGSGFLG